MRLVKINVTVNRILYVPFHKILYEHPPKTISGFDAILLQLHLCFKNYQNGMQFHRVTVKIKGEIFVS